MIKGVAFDLEGTLIDVEIAHHRAHLAIAKELGLHLTLKEAIYKIPSFVGGLDIQILKEIANSAGFKGSLSEILERDRSYYKKYLTNIRICSRPGVVVVLKYIKKLGLPVALGSGTLRADGLMMLNAASLRSHSKQNDWFLPRMWLWQNLLPMFTKRPPNLWEYLLQCN